MTSLAPPTPERRASPDATAEQRTARTPLAAVLAFTAANALSAGLVTSGMFFAARAGYGLA